MIGSWLISNALVLICDSCRLLAAAVEAIRPSGSFCVELSPPIAIILNAMSTIVPISDPDAYFAEHSQERPNINLWGHPNVSSIVDFVFSKTFRRPFYVSSVSATSKTTFYSPYVLVPKLSRKGMPESILRRLLRPRSARPIEQSKIFAAFCLV